jgi:hypothetical protein
VQRILEILKTQTKQDPTEDWIEQKIFAVRCLSKGFDTKARRFRYEGFGFEISFFLKQQNVIGINMGLVVNSGSKYNTN